MRRNPDDRFALPPDDGDEAARFDFLDDFFDDMVTFSSTPVWEGGSVYFVWTDRKRYNSSMGAAIKRDRASGIGRLPVSL